MKILAAVPASSGCPTCPAGMRCETRSCALPLAQSLALTAYPSIWVLSIVGTFNCDFKCSANKRPVASMVAIVSISTNGLAALKSEASASLALSIGGFVFMFMVSLSSVLVYLEWWRRITNPFERQHSALFLLHQLPSHQNVEAVIRYSQSQQDALHHGPMLNEWFH